MRWIMDALHYARYKQPVSGLSITKLIDTSDEQNLKKINSTSSHIDCLPSPSPSPEMHRRKAVSDSQPCSDEEGCSEVFLPTDSDYDSSDALSPRDLDLVYLSSHDIAQQSRNGLSGSAPDVLQVHDMKAPSGPGQDTDHSCAELLHNLTLTSLPPKNHAKMAPGARPPLGFLGKRKSEPEEAERLGPAPEGPRGLPLAHAASLPEERKSSLQDPRPAVHRIYVEAYPAALVDTKPWAALSPAIVGHSGLPSAAGPELSPEDPATSPVSEILSSML
ncbi:PREDICTED: uncharacterized protein LOC104997971 [Bison bison bison]|uniref:Uncharacterized protein LOC104997971 n=1 Tax=Bison bison bison TaxID=43346 RepID=A0A6P3IH79_BISBB|nr:PREDICTED: uncharacterized protein LOC104997971 [Bison bison bison]